MDRFYAIYFLFSAFSLFSQTGEIHGKILSTNNLPIQAITLELVSKDTVVSIGTTNYNGDYHLTAPFGTYDLKIYLRDLGLKDKVIFNFTIDSNSKQVDEIHSEECIESTKICPYHHEDEIVPIIYGLPSRKMIRLKNKGKIAIGGCFSLCPKWYCKKHYLRF